ncbi:hypothetical protein KIH74_05405 [Kineosporia sp. J2-2]|uniref:Uncharacterized protein n=1 Tax=Kineosporia corallincola TaxID=2835133 RepID=A0ABS5TBC2_9ACTN|nr:hypothetical protein [Kineosporia corallincola]MBT0768349.1 hypothetical protein [Kineosporia corallincola]
MTVPTRVWTNSGSRFSTRFVVPLRRRPDHLIEVGKVSRAPVFLVVIGGGGLVVGRAKVPGAGSEDPF